jgi:hypothetical protein
MYLRSRCSLFRDEARRRCALKIRDRAPDPSLIASDAAQMNLGGGGVAVELLIRDGSPSWWESPDIWVVPGTDPGGSPGTPVVGMPAYLWATVRNEGDLDVSQVQVDFWVADPSLQIRKSTANHIGTAFADIAAGGSQDVLCLVPWNVTLVNGGHECVVVEASSPADPLSPPPADPDVLDPPDYRQIAQRNLSVLTVSGMIRGEVILTVSAGARADKAAVVELAEGDALPAELLGSLGLDARHYAGAEKISAGLSERSLCGQERAEGGRALRLAVPRGTSAAAYLSVAAREPLAPGEYAVVRVIERDRERAIGGLSLVIVGEDDRKGGAR